MNVENLEETNSFCKTLNLLYVVRDKKDRNNEPKGFYVKNI